MWLGDKFLTLVYRKVCMQRKMVWEFGEEWRGGLWKNEIKGKKIENL